MTHPTPTRNTRSAVNASQRDLWTSVLLSGGLITLVGAWLYFIAESAYLRFYSDLRLRPEDVGLSYAGTLTRSAQLLFLVMPLVVLVAVALAAIDLCERIPVHISIGTGAVVVVIGIFIGGLFLVWQLPNQMNRRVACVEAGYEPTNIRFGGLTLLKVEAHRVSLEQIKSGAAPIPIANSPKLIYLGQSGGIASFWNADTWKALQLPTTSYAYSISGAMSTSTKDPPGCR
jgi:hypothetical protein